MKTHKIIFTAIALALIVWVIVYMVRHRTKSPIPVPENPNIAETYINSEYGFSIEYPKGLELETSFKSFYLAQARWRIYAPENSEGTPIISIPVHRIDHGGVATGKPFPLAYSAEVRIGVSSDTLRCFEMDSGYTTQVIREEMINGIEFKVFSFGEGAMMKYIEGESYRTIHNNLCFVIERIKTGSNYRDETMMEGKTDAELARYYEDTKEIIKTFTFIN